MKIRSFFVFVPNVAVILILVNLLTCIRRIVSAADEDEKLAVETIVERYSLRDTLYFELVEPEQIAYVYKIRPAKDFGVSLNQTLVDIELVPVLPVDGCGNIQNMRDVRGNVALVVRGECSFMSKAINAEKAGAVAIVVTDNDTSNDDKFIDMINDGTSRPVQIPTFFLLGRDGHMIRLYLDKLRLRSAVINIPLNVTLLSELPRQLPPWTIW